VDLRGWASYFFEAFQELIYDTLISIMTKVDPRNLMVVIIFVKKNLEQILKFSKFEFFWFNRYKPGIPPFKIIGNVLIEF
jgi:hypothetical protein